MDIDHHYFECDCHSNEHILKFVLDKEEPDLPSLYASIFLFQWRPWWKKVWVGIKYIFGYSCRHGHWDCWLLKDEDATRLRDMLDEYIKLSEESN